MADVYDVIVLRGPEYWTGNRPIFVSGLHTQEKAEDESETPVCTAVMWVLLICSSCWKDWLLECLFISYYDQVLLLREQQGYTLSRRRPRLNSWYCYWRKTSKINSQFSTQRKPKSNKPETPVSSIGSSEIFVAAYSQSRLQYQVLVGYSVLPGNIL
jgi:hypothetical protein